MSPPIALIPETAPFTAEQRAWLNGFLAGWIGLQGESGPPTATSTLAALPETSSGTQSSGVEPEDAPWHDPALALEDRLQLAQGRPLPSRLMAAMAQLDCGSCGYDCRRYAEAIASGEERSLSLCSPGGKATARKLKELVALESSAGTNGNGQGKGHGHAPAAATVDGRNAGSRWTRQNPFAARVLAVRNLNGPGSAKQTTHVELDLSGSGLTYDVGDALGVYPTNCPELVNDLLTALNASGDELVEIDGRELPLTQALRESCCLSEITDDLVQLMSERSGDLGHTALLKGLLDDPAPIDGWDVLDLLREFPSARLPATDLAGALARLRPRLYSISSSLKAHPGQVHLTVGRVAWQARERFRKGVASTMFSDRLSPGEAVRVFVQKSHGFTVPGDPAAPAIMIGPGTGIAPFRAFLQERQAAQAPGRNWLFFGDQRAATDFLYREELEAFVARGVLTRLETAFSRDQVEKVYVQTRMLEQGEELWRWLQSGAHVYVCGDARRMAVDVDKALRRIVAEQGRMDESAADRYVARLAQDRRYCRDVY